MSQPNYQRWESGSVVIPDDKLRKVAKVLHTTPDALQGKTRYARVSLDEINDDDQSGYWGEIAIHFLTATPPIVASISSSERKRIIAAMQTIDTAFLEVRGLCNEHYLVRRSAISELYASSDECDAIGPPDVHYEDFIDIHLLDHRLWDALVAYESDWLDDLPREDVIQALSYFMSTKEIGDYLDADITNDGQVDALPRDRSLGILAEILSQPSPRDADDPSVPPAVLERRKAFLLPRAARTLVRLSNGAERSFLVEEALDLSENVYNLTRLAPDETCVVVVALDEDDQMALFPSGAVDYIRFPAHHLERALDGLDVHPFVCSPVEQD